MSQMMHKLLRDILETTGGDHRRSVSAAAFARPNDANAYAIGDLVTNSTIAGNITALPFAVARPARSATPVDPATGAQAIFSGVIRRARLVKSSTTVANAQFRLHLFADGPPGAINGDNGVFTPTGELLYIGAIDITIDKAFNAASVGHGAPQIGGGLIYQLAAGKLLYGWLEARAAYVPTANETFTVALEIESD
jgi:hypothetical protein